jgi:hypothetical protein
LIILNHWPSAWLDLDDCNFFIRQPLESWFIFQSRQAAWFEYTKRLINLYTILYHWRWRVLSKSKPRCSSNVILSWHYICLYFQRWLVSRYPASSFCAMSLKNKLSCKILPRFSIYLHITLKCCAIMIST